MADNNNQNKFDRDLIGLIWTRAFDLLTESIFYGCINAYTQL